MLTVSDDERDVLQAMRAGADGYLLKDLEPEDLCSRLKLAARGSVVLESRIAAILTRASTSLPAHDEAELTERENQILGSLALGHSNKEIARQLGISDATVKVHIKNLLRKLNLKSRLEAAVWALNRGNPRAGGDPVQ
jgi:two-component system nitrate/nitrite response regulator NarL